MVIKGSHGAVGGGLLGFLPRWPHLFADPGGFAGLAAPRRQIVEGLYAVKQSGRHARQSKPHAAFRSVPSAAHHVRTISRSCCCGETLRSQKHLPLDRTRTGNARRCSVAGALLPGLRCQNYSGRARAGVAFPSEKSYLFQKEASNFWMPTFLSFLCNAKKPFPFWGQPP